MNDFIDAFRDEANVTVVITRANPDGAVQNPDGTITPGTPIPIYNGTAIKWQLTSNQQFASNKPVNPATARIVLFPKLILQPIRASDMITIDGVAYDLYPGEDILDQDVNVYDVAIKDAS